MTYQVDRYSSNSFDSGWPVLVNDETVNNSYGVNLLGRGVTNYGELIAENFIHLLENFAGNSSPPNPITGQIWYDADPSVPGSGSLRVWNGSSWDPIGGVPVGSTLPPNTSASDGDLYYLISNGKNQLFAYGDGRWNRVGGLFTQSSLPTGNNDGDLWFDTSLANNTSASNKQRMVKLYIAGSWYPIALGDPSGGAANNTSVFVDGNVLAVKSNGNILAAWSNIDMTTAPSSMQSVFPNGLKVGLNISNFTNNKITSPLSGSFLNLGENVDVDKNLNVGGNSTVEGFIASSINTSITATGTSQANAVEINKVNNFVTTVTSTANGVRLPAVSVMPIGAHINIWNLDSADTLQIYPNTGSQIDGAPANSPFLLGPGASVTLVRRTNTDFRSIKSIYG